VLLVLQQRAAASPRPRRALLLVLLVLPSRRRSGRPSSAEPLRWLRVEWEGTDRVRSCDGTGGGSWVGSSVSSFFLRPLRVVLPPATPSGSRSLPFAFLARAREEERNQGGGGGAQSAPAKQASVVLRLARRATPIAWSKVRLRVGALLHQLVTGFARRVRAVVVLGRPAESASPARAASTFARAAPRESSAQAAPAALPDQPDLPRPRFPILTSLLALAAYHNGTCHPLSC
jgi:hypothetical protein